MSPMTYRTARKLPARITCGPVTVLFYPTRRRARRKQTRSRQPGHPGPVSSRIAVQHSRFIVNGLTFSARRLSPCSTARRYQRTASTRSRRRTPWPFSYIQPCCPARGRCPAQPHDDTTGWLPASSREKPLPRSPAPRRRPVTVHDAEVVLPAGVSLFSAVAAESPYLFLVVPAPPRDHSIEYEHLELQLATEHRAGRRQAAPFAKKRPQGRGGRPGRRPCARYGRQGRRACPAHVDETLAAPAPTRCPGLRREGRSDRRGDAVSVATIEPTNGVVATTNVGHLSRYVQAVLWRDIRSA